MDQTSYLPLPDGVDNYRCTSALEFLHLLSARHPMWEGSPTSWIFRGQANAEWLLRPKASRKDDAFAPFGIERKAGRSGPINWEERKQLLDKMLVNFQEGLEQAGLPIPVPLPAVRSSPQTHSTAHPEPQAFPLMALAQHHRLPTILLDWTRRPFVAAYFAAEARRSPVGHEWAHALTWAEGVDVPSDHSDPWALGEACDSGRLTRGSVVTALLASNPRNALGCALLLLVSWMTGFAGARLGQRSLRALALLHLEPQEDSRTCLGKAVDGVLRGVGVQALFLPRGASCWLLVREKAKLLSQPGSKELEVYADITQGEDSTLFAGQVHQVIASASGETLSIVLFKARRYRRSWKPPTIDGATGTRLSSSHADGEDGPWKTIGQSEAFYMRGDCINNISYRVYGDPARDKYQLKGEWKVPELLVELAQILRDEDQKARAAK